MTTALGADVNNDGVGMDALTHRRIIQGEWVNTGIISGLAVTGQSSLFYNVAAGNAVCSNGAADGFTRAYWPGGNTAHQVAAGDATYPRIDNVYIIAGTSKSDNSVHVDVQQGTPSASPVAPTPPAGATSVRRMRMPAGATNTAAASPVDSADYAIPYGVALGRLKRDVVTAKLTVPEDNQWHQQCGVTFDLPTDRLLRFAWKAGASVGTSPDGDPNQRMGSYFLQLRLNGVAINDMTTTATGPGLTGQKCDEITVLRYNTPTSVTYEMPVAKGHYTLSAWVFGNKGWYTYPVTFVQSRELTVTDMGIDR